MFCMIYFSSSRPVFGVYCQALAAIMCCHSAALSPVRGQFQPLEVISYPLLMIACEPSGFSQARVPRTNGLSRDI